MFELSSFLQKKKNKFELQKKVFGWKDFCNVIIPSEDTKILEFNQYQKSDKTPFIDGCKNHTQNSSTTKIREHIPSGFSMLTALKNT